MWNDMVRQRRFVCGSQNYFTGYMYIIEYWS